MTLLRRNERVVGHILHPRGCLACGYTVPDGELAAYEPCHDQEKAREYTSKAYMAMPASQAEFDRWKEAANG